MREMGLLIQGCHFSESLTTAHHTQDAGNVFEFTIELMMSGSSEQQTSLALYMFFSNTLSQVLY